MQNHWQIKGTPRVAQQLLAESNTALAYSSVKKCQSSHLFVPGLSFAFCYKDLFFSGFPQEASHMQTLKNLSILQAWRTWCGEYRSIKCHVFNITPTFWKNVPVTQASFERALKTMSETIWKGAAALEDFQKKKKQRALSQGELRSM